MIEARIDQVDRPDQVVVVVEPLNEVAKPLRSVRCQMVDIFERIFFEQTVNEPMIQDRALYERGPFWNIVANTPLRSSRTMTSWPFLSNCSATWEPMNPAP